MKIIVSGTGSRSLEDQTFQKLESQLRDSWQAYRGLTINDGKGSMEFDLLIVTHDRLIVVELKHWNGKLTSLDGNWYVDGKIRGRSPALSKREHAYRLLTVLKDKLQHTLGYYPFVEAHVLLCGTSTTEHLPPREQRCTHTLEDFLKIWEAQGYEAIMGEQQVRFDEIRLRPNSPENLKHFDDFFSSRHIATDKAQEHERSTESPEALSQ